MKVNSALHWTIIVALFALLFTPLVVAKSLFFPFITGKAFFFRLIIEFIMGLWIFLAWRDASYRPRRSWILFSVLGLVAVSTLATIFSQDPNRSFWSNFERMDGLINYLHLLAYFLVISSTLKTERLWNWFLHTSIGVSLVVCGYSFAQLAGAVPISQGRLDATMGNAIYLAAYLLFHFFFTLFFLFKSRGNRWLVAIYSLIALVQLYVLYRTATRGAVVGLFVGLFVTCGIMLWKRWSDIRSRWFSLSVITLMILIVGGVYLARGTKFVQDSPVLSRFASISATETTTESRLTIWQMSLRGFTEHPVLGWGPENYNLVFNKYYEPKLWRQEQWFDRSHNIFLDWLIDAGLLGLLAYLGIFFSAVYYLWSKKIRQVDLITKALFTGLLCAYLVNNIFAFDNLTSYLIFFAFLAYLHYHVAHSLEDNNARPSKKLDEGDQILQGIIIFVLVASFSSASYYFTLRPMIVSARLITALNQVPGGNGDPNQVAKNNLDLFNQLSEMGALGSREVAEQFASRAREVVRAPQISSETKQAFAAAALSKIQKEIESSPQDARLRLLRGITLDSFGQPALAIESIAKALELSPKKQTIIFQLAGAYLELGDKKRSRELAEQAFNLDKNFPEARRFYALTLIYSGDLKSAEKILAEGVNLELDDRFINAYVAVGRYDLVLKLWQDKVRQEPGNPQNRFSLAASYLTNGQRNLAIQELQSAGEIAPNLKGTVDHLISEIRAGRNPIAQ